MAHAAATNLKRAVTQRGKNSLEVERDKFEHGQVGLQKRLATFLYF